MRYAYYPGCSVGGTGRAYEESLEAVLEAFDIGLDELNDWNCCGASAAHSVDPDKATALGVRNLALAESAVPGSDAVDLFTPCAGCFRALLTAQGDLQERTGVAKRVDHALQTVGLHYDRRVRVRHVLDLLANEVGVERVKATVARPLSGLKVACYYGCLLVRPTATFDDQRDPMTMDNLMTAIGAEPIEWPMKTRCCGGSCYGADPFSGPTPQGALSLSFAILREAKRRGADAVVTACPLCLFNLEAFQEPMTREFGMPLDLTVGYFTQFLGLAMGLDEKSLGIHRMLRWKLPSREPVSVGGGDDV